MLRVTQIKLPVGHSRETLQKALTKRLGVSASSLRSWQIERRAIDARKKPDICYVYTLTAELDREDLYCKKRLPSGVAFYRPSIYRFPYQAPDRMPYRPVIVGAGPAGLFCGWMLARYGFRPILLERGDVVDKRRGKTADFWENGRLDPESNVQFGEGGAGTFSDGKLYTGVKDSSGRNREVMRIFVEAGGDAQILYDAHAHIGTDELGKIVTNIRKQIEAMGGEVHFRTLVKELVIRNGKIAGVQTHDGRVFETEAVILAIGHSARDTFRMLSENHVIMEPKPFAVGVRVQHEQELITRLQYGNGRHDEIGPASYKLHTHTHTGRAVYSFCMCPGGYVINASSSEGMLAVNGMSEQARNSGYANSAIVTAVTPADCLSYIKEECDPLFSGMRFQERLESKAWLAVGGSIPVQRLADFRQGGRNIQGSQAPCVKGQADYVDIRPVFPKEISVAILEGMDTFDHQLSGFADDDTLLFGVESRTSSPIRILREADMQNPIKGIFPCGEGAGYAGGITSAAIDGIRSAEAVASSICGNRGLPYTEN